MEPVGGDIFGSVRPKRDFSTPTNLKCIYVFLKDSELTFLADRELTGIASSLSASPKQGGYRLGPAGEAACPGHFFSAFLGEIAVGPLRLLLFANRVRTIELGLHRVFQVESISVYRRDTLTLESALSGQLAALLCPHSLFSYTLDLTDNSNYEEAFLPRGRPLKSRLNWLYLANRLAVAPLLPRCKIWAISLIFGQISSYRDPSVCLTLLYKKSIFEISRGAIKDPEVLYDFYCPSKSVAIDCIISSEKSLLSFGIVLCNLPPGSEAPADVGGIMEGDRLINGGRSEKKSRFFQFLHAFANVRAFAGLGEGARVLGQVIRENGIDPGAKGAAKSEVSDWVIDRDSAGFPYTSHEQDLSLEEIIETFEGSLGEGPEDLMAVARGVCEGLRGRRGKGKFGIALCSEDLPEEVFLFYQIVFLEFVGVFEQETGLRADGVVARGLEFGAAALEQLKQRKAEPLRSSLGSERGVEALSGSWGSGVFGGSQREAEPMRAEQMRGSAYLSDCLFGSGSSLSDWYRSLLSDKEAFTSSEITIGLVTHNCGGCLRPSEVHPFLNYPSIPEIQACDILIVGLQEIIEMKSRNLGSILTGENYKAVEFWRNVLENRFPAYKIQVSVSLLGLFLAVMVRENNAGAALCLAVENHGLRKLGGFGLANKGAIVINLKVNFDTLGIVNCHLKSGNGSKEASIRGETLRELNQLLEKQRGCSARFILGDFNFRNGGPPSPSTAQPFASESLRLSPSADEFRLAKASFQDLSALEEAPLSFAPTYRVTPFEFRYDTRKNYPAWTDRVLFSADDSTLYAPLVYDSDTKTGFSDHYPVYQVGKLLVREISMAKFKHIFD